MTILESKEISKSYNDKIIIKNINLELKQGEFVSIVGKSGTGKTTLLHILGKILNPTSGSINYNPPNLKPAMVFQEYNKSLFPWLTVFQNLKLVLNSNLESLDEHILYYLSLVGLEHSKNKYPWELSSGMQQRVSIARALVYKPSILLMDEPFGSLDSGTKNDLESDLLDLWKKLNLTILMITHDIEEAIFMSNRVLILSENNSGFKDCIKIDLEYPRDQITTMNSNEFIQYRTIIMKHFISP
jgi:NitT/TauT family transport system ATP-binding protein